MAYNACSAAIGVFITLEPPTSEMLKEAVTANYYRSPHWGDYPAIQFFTIEDLLHGAKVKMPFTVLSSTIKQAQIVGFYPNKSFKILGVLEKPIPYSFIVEFAKRIADKFKADFAEV